MYSLDINFLNDRPEYAKQKPGGEGGDTGGQVNLKEATPLVVGIVVAALLAGGAFQIKSTLDRQNAQLEREVGQATSSLGEIEKKKSQIQAIESEIEGVKAQTEALATVFNQIKPWSALLQELRDRAPSGIQIEGIQQVIIQPPPPGRSAPADPNAPPVGPRPGLEIRGLARSYNDVNNLLLLLQNSKFFSGDETQLVSASMQANPVRVETPDQTDITVELPPIVQYQIRTPLSAVPASEILAELERKGAVGLVSRIETLEKIMNEPGVFQQ